MANIKDSEAKKDTKGVDYGKKGLWEVIARILGMT